MSNVFKKIINVLSYVVLAILIIYVLNIVYFRVMKKEKLPRIFNYYTFKVITGSMEDTIHVGDYIIVKKTDKVKKNDIVTFEKDGVFITHRIIKIDKDKIITKGDANNAEDDPITKKQVLGKYIGKAKLLGFIVKYKIIIITILLIIYILNILLQKIKK